MAKRKTKKKKTKSRRKRGRTVTTVTKTVKVTTTRNGMQRLTVTASSQDEAERKARKFGKVVDSHRSGDKYVVTVRNCGVCPKDNPCGMKPKKRKNPCYATRYGDRYGRNFAVPSKKKGETWAKYHDRLSALASRLTGDASRLLQKRAGEIARKYKSVREKTRKGKSVGPGTYSWAQCIRTARRSGAASPKAVCGAIRARSKKRYPEYWKARKRNPGSPDQYMDAAASNVANAMSTPDAQKRRMWFQSANRYANAAAMSAEQRGNDQKVAEARALSSEIRKLSSSASTWARNKAKRNGPKRNGRDALAAAQKRAFMRI